MPNILIKTEVNRVDLVPEGACSEAYIMLFKGREGIKSMANKVVEEILSKLKPEFRTAIEEHVVAEVDLAKAACKKEFESKEETDEEKANKKKMADDLAKATADKEAAEGALAKAKGELDTLQASLDTELAKSKGPVDEFEEVLKSAPEGMKAFLIKTKALQDDMLAKAKASEEAKDLAEALAKAKELSCLPVDEATLVEVIKSKDAKVISMLEVMAKSADESGLFKSIGSGTPGASTSVGAIDLQITALAKEKGLTNAKAMVEFFKQNPEMYTTYNGGAE